jgi:hypothetical protein
MFPTTHTTALFGTRGRGQALEAWREAARIVGARWQVFLEADPETHAWAFASYLAALDAEQAAADELAWLSSGIAA